MANPAVQSAVCTCSFGAAPMPLAAVSQQTVRACGMTAATVMDNRCTTFGMCTCPANPAVQAATAAALGVPLGTLLRIVEPLCRSGKLQAVDLVEFNPLFDIDGQGARVAARVAWQIAHWWR